MGLFALLLMIIVAITAILIWNPCIRKILVLPKTSVELTKTLPYKSRCVFGFDSRTDDYKVLRVVNDTNAYACQVEIWSLARSSWKNLEAHVIPVDFSISQFFDNYSHDVFGNLHWLQLRRSRDFFIASFVCLMNYLAR